MKFLSGKNSSAEMPFLDHLEELRWRVLWSVLAITIGSIIGFWLVTRFAVLELLIDPIQPYLRPMTVTGPNGTAVMTDERLGYLSPMDPFFVTLKLAITVGVLLAFPIVAYQIWSFVSPALHKREKKAIVPALYLGLVLFLAGVALAYFVVLPMTFQFADRFQTESLRQQIVIGPYMAMVTKVLLAFGLVFELPVVVMVLSALGLISSKFLAEKRRFAIAGAAVLAALLSPGDAVTVTIFMMGPIILLYEMSIGIARLMERRRRKALMAEPMTEAL